MDALSAKAVLLQELSRGPGFGLELVGRVRSISGGAVTLSEGAVYTALRDLEREGLIASAGTESRGDRGGRPRQLYQITEAGQRTADEHRAAVMALYGGTEARCGQTVGATAEETEPAPVERIVVLDEPEGDA